MNSKIIIVSLILGVLVLGIALVNNPPEYDDYQDDDKKYYGSNKIDKVRAGLRERSYNRVNQERIANNG